MDQFDDWHQRISEGEINGALQNEIADKILELLRQKKDSMSGWENLQFAHAITGLSINIHSIYQPTEAGLNKCLIALRTAILPEKASDDSNAQSNDVSELFNYGKLVTTVEKIKEQII